MPSVIRLARDVAAKVWLAGTAPSRQGWQWLLTPRDPITWTTLRAKLTTLPLLPSTYAGRLGVPLSCLMVSSAAASSTPAKARRRLAVASR